MKGKRNVAISLPRHQCLNQIRTERCKSPACGRGAPRLSGVFYVDWEKLLLRWGEESAFQERLGRAKSQKSQTQHIPQPSPWERGSAGRGRPPLWSGGRQRQKPLKTLVGLLWPLTKVCQVKPPIRTKTSAPRRETPCLFGPLKSSNCLEQFQAHSKWSINTEYMNEPTNEWMWPPRCAAHRESL